MITLALLAGVATLLFFGRRSAPASSWAVIRGAALERRPRDVFRAMKASGRKGVLYVRKKLEGPPDRASAEFTVDALTDAGARVRLAYSQKHARGRDWMPPEGTLVAITTDEIVTLL